MDFLVAILKLRTVDTEVVKSIYNLQAAAGRSQSCVRNLYLVLIIRLYSFIFGEDRPPFD